MPTPRTSSCACSREGWHEGRRERQVDGAARDGHYGGPEDVLVDGRGGPEDAGRMAVAGVPRAGVAQNDGVFRGHPVWLRKRRAALPHPTRTYRTSVARKEEEQRSWRMSEAQHIKELRDRLSELTRRTALG